LAATGSCVGCSVREWPDTARRMPPRAAGSRPLAAAHDQRSRVSALDPDDLDAGRKHRCGRDVTDRVWIRGDERGHLGVVRLLDRPEAPSRGDCLLPVSLHGLDVTPEDAIREELANVRLVGLIDRNDRGTALPGGDLLEEDVRELRA